MDNNSCKQAEMALRELVDGYFYDVVGNKFPLSPLMIASREVIISGALESMSSLSSAYPRLVEALKNGIEHSCPTLPPNHRALSDGPQWVVDARSLLRELGELK